MIKENIRIKEHITLSDKVNAVESIVSSYFTTNPDTGEVDYTPYYANVAQVLAVVTNFIEGIYFEPNEDIYECVTCDNDLLSLVDEFFSNPECSEDKNLENSSYVTMRNVMACVVDKVDFIKQRLIHQKEDSLSKLLDALTAAVNKIADVGIDNEQLATMATFAKKVAESDLKPENIVSAYLDSAEHDHKVNEVIADKNRKIKELEPYKNKHKSKNGSSDK